MKTFILVFATLIAFASCKKEEGCVEIAGYTPDPNIEVPDCLQESDIYTLTDGFDIAIIQDGFANDSTVLGYECFSFPASNDWALTFYNFVGSSNANKVYNLWDGTGAFDFNFVQTWTNGTQDTIYGSGYFDLDTFYVNYDYINLEDNTIFGSVNMHSY